MNHQLMKSRVLWQSDASYSNYRIPGMIVTGKGTVLAYCEARNTSSDWARMDILMQRSTNGGESFEPPVLLAHGTEVHPTVNNPVMAQDRNGRIHFLHCENYGIREGRILHRFSDDDGQTWSSPDDITYATKPEYRNVFAIGPGHGICSADGTLLFPVWMVPKSSESPLSSHHPSVISTLYSRDCGKTWEMGEILQTTAEMITPNETELTLLENGTVYLNCRLGGGITYRGHAYSKTGYSEWKEFCPDYKLWDPCCFGSTVSFQPKGLPFTVFFANCNSKLSRKNVTIYASFNSGRTWCRSVQIDPDQGGYVETAVNPSTEQIYVLYEQDDGKRCVLCTLTTDWML